MFSTRYLLGTIKMLGRYFSWFATNQLRAYISDPRITKPGFVVGEARPGPDQEICRMTGRTKAW